MIIGLDAGNWWIKMFGPFGAKMLSSFLGEYRDLYMKKLGPQDIVFEYKGRKGFAGELAQNESEFAGTVMGTSKAHDDMVIRVLLGLHQYSLIETNYHIVVGSPIKTHTDAEKEKIKQLLLGEHEFTVNHVSKMIRIHGVEVAPEGIAAYWSSPRKGLVRIIDFGSGTVNCGTLKNGVYIERESFTIEFGMNTNINQDAHMMARAVAAECLKKWKRTDACLLVGGSADKMLEPMKSYFYNATVLRPMVANDTGGSLLHPVYANAVAFYNIGEKVYANVVQAESN